MQVEFGSSLSILESAGFNPSVLGIEPNDPVLDKFAHIVVVFSKLWLPIWALPEDQRRKIINDDQKGELTFSSPSPDFVLGRDYFFGRNAGTPETIHQCAAAAIYHKRQGVEVEREMKSCAFSSPTNPLVIVHVLGDVEVDQSGLAKILHEPETDIRMADPETLMRIGVEHGTVNPFITADVDIRHIFDKSVRKSPDKYVITSTGDSRFFLAFDWDRYLKAKYGLFPRQITVPISYEKTNIFSKRPVFVLGGDSALDAYRFCGDIETALIRMLRENKKFFGDRSPANIQPIIDRCFAASIDPETHGQELKALALEKAYKIIEEHKKKGVIPIITCASYALNGVVGKELNQLAGIEYIGPKEITEGIFDSLKEAGVEISRTLLLGLPSIYNSMISALSGKTLERSLDVNDRYRQEIDDCIQKCKTGDANPIRLYQIIESILRTSAHIDFTSEAGNNIAVVLAASELESLVARFHPAPKTVTVIKSVRPQEIVQKLGEIQELKPRIIFIQPSKTLAEVIAEKTFVTV